MLDQSDSDQPIMFSNSEEICHQIKFICRYHHVRNEFKPNLFGLNLLFVYSVFLFILLMILFALVHHCLPVGRFLVNQFEQFKLNIINTIQPSTTAKLNSIRLSDQNNPSTIMLTSTGLTCSLLGSMFHQSENIVLTH